MKTPASLIVAMVLLLACTNTEKDSVEIADSINKANIDTALAGNKTVIDEGSASFLVDAANSSMAEIDLGALATQKAASQAVKNFASMIVSEHSASHEQIRNLAAQKNVTLPDSIGSEKRKEIDLLKGKAKKDFDKAFMDRMINDHETAIKSFENALTGTKDPDVNSFADRTLMKLRMHLDSAKSVRSSLQ